MVFLAKLEAHSCYMYHGLAQACDLLIEETHAERDCWLMQYKLTISGSIALKPEVNFAICSMR